VHVQSTYNGHNKKYARLASKLALSWLARIEGRLAFLLAGQAPSSDEKSISEKFYSEPEISAA
jgi:hypothetical protein